MTHTTRRDGMMIAIALIITVVMQIYYMVTLGGPSPAQPDAGLMASDVIYYFDNNWNAVASVWMIELAAYGILAVAGLAALSKNAPIPAVWGALMLAGLFNMIQLAMGLGLFRLLAEAGQDMFAIWGSVVAGAFFFYFLAKVFLGLAGIGLGLLLFRNATVSAKIIGGISILAGLAAAVTNILALPQGMAQIFPAGATGTIAAMTTGIAALLVTRQATSE